MHTKSKLPKQNSGLTHINEFVLSPETIETCQLWHGGQTCPLYSIASLKKIYSEIYRINDVIELEKVLKEPPTNNNDDHIQLEKAIAELKTAEYWAFLNPAHTRQTIDETLKPSDWLPNHLLGDFLPESLKTDQTEQKPHPQDIIWEVVQRLQDAIDKSLWSKASNNLIGKVLASPIFDENHPQYPIVNILYLDNGGFEIVYDLDKYVEKWDKENLDN